MTPTCSHSELGVDLTPPCSHYLPRNVADKSEGNLVWPGQRHELVPPPVDHLVHVEPGEESDGDVVAEPPRIDADDLKPLSRWFVLKQDFPSRCKTI